MQIGIGRHMQFGFAVHAFSSAEAFLASDVVGETSCLLLDIAMPGMSGPEWLFNPFGDTALLDALNTALRAR